MSKTLEQIAQQLKDTDKKVQLIYAFNGTGKTRLSLEFKKLMTTDDLFESRDLCAEENIFGSIKTRNNFLYYNAYTEDLFYWDNDQKNDAEPKLKIQPNSFIDWILMEQGDVNIIENFQRYTNKNLIPKFVEKEEIQKDKDGRNIKVKTYPEVMFTTSDTSPENIDESDIKIDENDLVKRGRDKKIKISKGEESNFVWSVFYTLLKEVTSILEDVSDNEDKLLAEADAGKRQILEEMNNNILKGNQFNLIKYVFIDDPVSSLDDNHLIELAVDLATLIKKSPFKNGKGLRFVITTHNPLFYNVLYNELLNNDLYKNKSDKTYSITKIANDENCERIYKRGQAKAYRLIKQEDGTFNLEDSNDRPFSYHIFLLNELRVAIKNGTLEQYHFNFLRNILEKTATFLGHKHWSSLVEKADPDLAHFANRILNLFSHSAHAGDEISDITANDKENIEKLVKALSETYGFYEAKEKQNAGTN